MSSKSEEKISVNLNGRSCSESSVGAIGFSDSRSTAQQYKQGKCDSAIATVCTDGDGDNGESTGDSDSCNSESELTGRKERRRNLTDHREPISHNNSDVHSSLVTTVGPLGAVRFSGRRPRVGFVDMEISDSCANKKDISKDLSKLSRKGTGSVRYTQPRLSLLGKPINYKMHKRDLRYRRVQSRIYNFLERPKFWYAFFYHIGICVVCIGALVLSTLSTIKEFEPLMSTTSMYLEPLLLLWLMVEYSIRIWASGCRSRYQGLQGRLRFAQRPLCIVDLAIIISTLLVIIIGSTSDKFAPSTLRGLRFFQILRMVRMDRRAGTWKLLASVIWAHRRELLTTLYIGFLGLLFSSYLVYLAEKDKDPDRFGTYADALWWGVVTLCTVGYGDVVPTTWAGKLIASLSAVSGIAFFALPAGILGSGFALKVQQQQRQKHLIRRRVPAALLIQSLWRCYAADENSMSIATWKPHMVPLPSPTQERPFKNNTSFVSRFSTKRKDRGSTSNSGSGNISPHSPMVPRRDSRKNGSCSEEEIPDTLQRSHLSLATGLVDQRVDRIAMINKENSIQSFCSKQDQSEVFPDEPDLSPKIRELTETHKKAIRSLRKIKYFVARRKFREALRPYDVKDVIEQYSAGHVDMLGRVKSLQFRLDQILGKSGSKNKDVYESKVSLSSRIVKVERQVEDIESKLDLLIDLYKEDRKMLVQVHKSLPEVIPHTVLRDDTQQSQPKPRSILIDKQYTSEPSSPITGRHPKRFMQRNHSDLSSRIRKRVTYRLHSGPLGNVYSSPHFEDSLIPENTISKSMWEPCDNNGAIVSNIDGCYDPYETSNQSSSEDILQNNSQDQFTCDSRRSNINDSGIKEHIDTSVESSDGFPQCQSINESGSSTQPDSSNVESHLDDISFCDPITPESESPPVLCNTDFTIAMNSTDHAKHLETQMLSGQSHNQVADHVVLMPIGTTQALVADVTDV